MNKRIKELSAQARNYALDEKRIYERVHNTEQCMEEYREVYNKKFAELIIGECMQVADEGMAQVTMRVEWPSYHIKKHFGVE